jgi:hypothetical protein
LVTPVIIMILSFITKFIYDHHKIHKVDLAVSLKLSLAYPHIYTLYIGNTIVPLTVQLSEFKLF